MKNLPVQRPLAARGQAWRAGWKRAAKALIGGLVLAATAGCVVAPAPYYHDERYEERYEERPAQVYVEPAYASPGVGWVWVFQPRIGWGWHHPRHGWHDGGRGRGRGRH